MKHPRKLIRGLVGGGLLLLVGGIILSACNPEYRPLAEGPYYEIHIVSDTTYWNGTVGEAIRDELAKPIITLPQPEPAFDLVFNPLISRQMFEQVKKKQNIVIAAPLDGDTPTARFLRDRLDSAVVRLVREGKQYIFQRPNLWYRDQMVVYITAPTAEILAQVIHQEGENLRYLFNTLARQRLARKMFAPGRETEIEEHLMERHDFMVQVQLDYVLVQDTLTFVRLRRVLPDTWRDLFVYYIENGNPELIEPEWIYRIRDSLTQVYVRGTRPDSYVKIDRRRPLVSKNINFLGRFAYETRGLWHLTGDAMGGPFLNYTFYDEKQHRIYMIDGMVFAPGYPKREFLRQLEVIAYTFRTRQEVESGQDKTNGVQ